MQTRKTLEDSLIEDDASRLLDSLRPEERRPQLKENELGPYSENLSAEEQKSARNSFAM